MTDEEEKGFNSCKHILKYFDGNSDYGVLVISSREISCIYLVYSGELYRWFYKTY